MEGKTRTSPLPYTINKHKPQRGKCPKMKAKCEISDKISGD